MAKKMKMKMKRKSARRGLGSSTASHEMRYERIADMYRNKLHDAQAAASHGRCGEALRAFTGAQQYFGQAQAHLESSHDREGVPEWTTRIGIITFQKTFKAKCMIKK